MSRIGRLPVAIPAGVTVNIDNNVVKVKGPLGENSVSYIDPITVTIEDNNIYVRRPDDKKENRALHGLYRAMIYNAVTGVTKLFERGLMVKGVGFKMNKAGKKVTMNIGYSHPVEIIEPDGVTIDVISNQELKVSGIDKAKVGQCAADIKSVKPVEPYHNYGIYYKDEVVVKKEGKTAGKK
jgi:large subunit ribosomal protein L6